MIGEIRQGREEGSWAGKPGGFTGLFRFISKDANEPQERCICIDPLLQDSTVSAFFLQRGHDSNLFLCYKHSFFFSLSLSVICRRRGLSWDRPEGNLHLWYLSVWGWVWCGRGGCLVSENFIFLFFRWTSLSCSRGRKIWNLGVYLEFE